LNRCDFGALIEEEEVGVRMDIDAKVALTREVGAVSSLRSQNYLMLLI
jgi:hypothetical protein